MSQEEPRQFSIDQFAEEIENAANNQTLLIASATASPQYWALKGKPAVTSLLVEGILAIDRFPKNAARSDEERLTDAGKVALSSVGTLISLSPLYDSSQYNQTISAMGDGRGNYHSLLSNPAASALHAEYGLGILHEMVSGPIYKWRSEEERAIERRGKQNGIVKAMRLNGSVDPDISAGLADIRASGEHTDQEYFDGVLELARLTEIAVNAGKTAIENYNRPSASFRRWLRKRI